MQYDLRDRTKVSMCLWLHADRNENNRKKNVSHHQPLTSTYFWNDFLSSPSPVPPYTETRHTRLLLNTNPQTSVADYDYRY